MSDPSSPSDWPPKSAADFPRIGALPAYVFAQVNAEKAERMAAGEDVIDLGMGNPDLGTPQHIVDELVEHARDRKHHRYSASRGIHGLREGMAEHYRDRYGVELDPETEVVVTIGAKEGIAHLMLAILEPGDTVIIPSPAYPIHRYAVGFAGGRVHALRLREGEPGCVDGDALLADVEAACRDAQSPPKVLVLSFPNNPTTLQAPDGFLERAVEVCRRNRLLLVHDFAYADFGFDGEPPSVLAVPGAKEVAVEFFSMSKSYCMAGWRVGFCVGSPALVGALTKIKSYLDYGIFQPIQIAAAHALRAGQECVGETREVYRRRAEALVGGLHEAGWPVPVPRATMFVWTPIPAAFAHLDSVSFARMLLREAGVVVSPGVGFGPEGEGHVRFALIEPESRLEEAAARIARVLRRTEAAAA
ncbi:MAG TPA: aminotransferase class I/II-fold pyridoxal phosphate-dependent enzyme [Longimicrobium sp.]